MTGNIHACDLKLTPHDNQRLLSLCGQFDEHIHQIERGLGVEINNRGNRFQIIGMPESVEAARYLLSKLYNETDNGNMLTPEKIHLSIREHQSQTDTDEVVEDKSLHTTRTQVKPRNHSQRVYLDNIQKYDINFGVGPAGTGKTYLAVACAVAALEAEQVRRILLVRPAVEAGERLGFLPGDLSQKIDPYLRPLYDALYEMIGFTRVAKLVEQAVIEVAPLAYMRGRTLNDAFVILDESQNTTIEQMKMFLTRIGFGSKAVITGDVTQIDLQRGTESGLRHIISVLKDTKDISFTFFNACDAVRHPMVQTIIEAYERYESKNNR